MAVLNNSKNRNIMASFLNTKTVQGSGAAPKEFPIKMIDIHNILPNENNCYAVTNPEGLAFEMELNGNHVDPLEVIDNGDGTYRLVAGHRRRAAVLLRLERGDDIPSTVPCMVKEYKDDDLLSAQDREIIALIASNAQREKSTFEKLHEIVAIEPLARKIYENKLSEKKVSGSFRKFFSDNFLDISSSALQRLQSLQKLIPEGKEALEKGILTETAAAVLASLEEDDQVEYLLMLDDGQVDSTVAAIKEFKERKAEPEPEPESEPDLHPEPTSLPESAEEDSNDEDLSEEDLEKNEIPVSDSVSGGITETNHDEVVNHIPDVFTDSEDDTDSDIAESSEEADKTDSDMDNSNNPVTDNTGVDGSFVSVVGNEQKLKQESMKWAIDSLRLTVLSTDEQIKLAQEAGDLASESLWTSRKAALLSIIATYE
ncbi:hypothetical protein NZ47_02805 [Anaerovibrio lipolyticus]|uniref:ParB-like N-terminal domain-containing protein n=1 Tax=Anaerovibrio lipolyticus TaxID=82374 RepID=A0A0B2JZ26_9FIRM|nr:ParB N-terminal domain-containing protein [Anaerovibrio lipolyticus]KHM52784.1 hypothetical protein NZ47_02805 [Anaerovibrio lipolyticus]